jgi:hypothetical protein
MPPTLFIELYKISGFLEYLREKNKIPFKVVYKTLINIKQ